MVKLQDGRMHKIINSLALYYLNKRRNGAIGGTSSELSSDKMTCNNYDTKISIRAYRKSFGGRAYCCTKCKKFQNIRVKSLFVGTRIDSSDKVSIIQAPYLNIRTVNDWYSFCRDICIKYFRDEPIQFSNSTTVKSEVQIDEPIFGKKRMYHKGKFFNRFWTFGISDPEKHLVHVEIVDC